MATAALMAGSIAMKGMETGAKNKSAQAKQTAANQATARQIAELQRQTERDKGVAAEQKSDRAKELDRKIGSIMAAGADGGATGYNIGASAGAEGAVKGLDISRIESNRRDRAEGRFAESTSLIEENRARKIQTKNEIRSNNIAFFSSAVSTVAGGFSPGGPFHSDTVDLPSTAGTPKDDWWGSYG